MLSTLQVLTHTCATSSRDVGSVPLVPDQEVSNAEFRNANSAFGSGSQVGEDPQNLIDEVKEIFGVMQVTDNVGDPVTARWVYRNCPVTVSQKVTSADLVELEIVDFDVILGMYWFQFCHASVNCRIQVVQFQFPNEPVLE
ncbi:hypothetical protein MTR67_022608 [Solanum verrucosum]|uniref:Uncharacterized protein n=1 Tax=Solanum verrucosum TaxID=315347 RepID=A0AAF0QVM9_SOLVR|nr:hypothetical protein MTR67_022608 [Solanum verrucosum]